MVAIIKTGGKQYFVRKGMVLYVEKLNGHSGEDMTFSDVCLVQTEDSCHIGAPYVPGARVLATLVEQVRGEKVIIFKKKRRHNYRRKNGHRQSLSLVRIKDIVPPNH